MRVTLLVIFALLLSSCVSPYNIMVHNAGTSDVSKAEVLFGSKPFSVGWVVPNQSKMHIDVDTPIPKKATVKWRRDEVSTFEKTILVSSKLPPKTQIETFNLVFIINEDDSVELEVVTCSSDLPCPELFKR